MKKEIHNVGDLKNAIKELQIKKDGEEAAIKGDFKDVYETYRPANLIKNTLNEVASAPKFRQNMLNVALGLGAGYLSQKMVVGKSAGLLKKILGTALQFGVTSLVAKRGAENETDLMSGKKPGLLKRIFSAKPPASSNTY